MSLEAAIEKNTAALEKFMAMLTNGATLPAAPAATTKPVKDKPAAATPAPAAVVDEPLKPIPEVAALATDHSPAASEFTIDDASKLVVAMANKCGRDNTVALLSTFGAAKATALAADKVDGFCKAAKAAIDIASV